MPNWRQFAFSSNYNPSGTNKVFYHCLVKVCEKADEATCSTKDLTGTALPACTAVTDYTPTGRRRKRGVKEMGLIHENNILYASIEVKGTYDHRSAK